MSKVDLMAKGTQTLAKIKFNAIKHSPVILLGVGLVGGVTAAVLACKETTKAHEIKEKKDATLQEIKEVRAMTDEEEYSTTEYRKDVTKAYGLAVVNYAKLYAPSVILGTVSIASILSSYGIMRKRNIALAGSLAASLEEFRKYRERVIEKYDENVDNELRYGVKTVTQEEKITDEKGKIKTSKKEFEVVDKENIRGPYSVVFDDGNVNWEPAWDRDENWDRPAKYVSDMERFFNDQLQSRGYLFWSECLEQMGFADQIVEKHHTDGWTYVKGVHEPYVDLGVFKTNITKNRDFINGYEKAVILNPNVEGYILDKFVKARDKNKIESTAL